MFEMGLLFQEMPQTFFWVNLVIQENGISSSGE
jgi:hypothetical protein